MPDRYLILNNYQASRRDTKLRTFEREVDAVIAGMAEQGRQQCLHTELMSVKGKRRIKPVPVVEVYKLVWVGSPNRK